MRWRLIIIWIAIILTWIGLNIPANQIRVERTFRRMPPKGQMVGVTKQFTLKHKTGGFPWTFCQFTEANKNQPREYKTWSLSALGWNIVAAISLGILANGYIVYSYRTRDTDAGKKTRQFSIGSLLVGTTFLAICLAVYNRNANSPLFGVRGFYCERADAELPEWLVKAIDVGFLLKPRQGVLACKNRNISRIDALQSVEKLTLSSPTSRIASEVFRLPNLRRLTVSRAELDQSFCDAFANNSTLSFFSISFDHTPSSELLTKLFDVQKPESLKCHLLIESNPNEEVLIEGLRCLTSVAVRQQQSGPSIVVLKDLPKVTNVNGFDGMLSSLEVENLPELKSVEWPGDGDVKLTNLAKLWSLKLGPVGNLSLRDLPGLKYRDGYWDKTRSQYPPKGIHMATSPTEKTIELLGEYAGALSMNRCNKLSVLLKALQTRNPAVLDFSVGGSGSGWPSNIQLDFDALETLPRVKKLIAYSFWFRNRPIYQLLTKTPNLTELTVSSDFRDEQIPLLSRLTRLEELDLTDSRITNDGRKQLPSLPNLKRLKLPSRFR